MASVETAPIISNEGLTLHGTLTQEHIQEVYQVSLNVPLGEVVELESVVNLGADILKVERGWHSGG